MTGRQAFNVVTDTVAGPNLRLKDNLLQGLAIGVCMALGAGIGFLVGHKAGAILGAVLGMVLGLLGSGIFLMVYRAVAHIRGKHE